MVTIQPSFGIWLAIEVESGFRKYFRKNNKPSIVFYTTSTGSTLTSIDKINYHLKLWNLTLTKNLYRVYENCNEVGCARKIARTENYIIVLAKVGDAHKIALSLGE